nr:hypothetical protein [Tanacetum cinerariifolium]
ETVYKEWEDIIERAATTASSLEVEQDSGNINITQSMSTLNELLPLGTGSGSRLRCQVTILGGAEAQTRYALTGNPTVYASYVKKFWTTAKVKKEDASKQGRSTEDIDQDVKIVLVDKAQGRIHDAYMFGVDDLEGNEVIIDVREKIVEKEVSTADPVTTADEVVTAASVDDSAAPTTATTTDVNFKLTLVKTLNAIKAAKPKVISTTATTVTTAITTPRAKGQELGQESAKKQKLAKQEQAKVADDDTAELKRCLEIFPKDDDDVAIEATTLSSKSPTIVDYKIYIKGKKSYFKIIRTMFEPHIEDIIWKYQQGAVKVNNWKLFDSCGVYCVTTKNIMYYLMVKKM